MKSRRFLILAVIAIALSLFIVAYTGYVTTYLDHENQTTFFIKRFPAFKIKFYDPFANEGDPPSVSGLPPNDRKMFADYCKYRFGIKGDDIISLEQCQKEIPNYLKEFHL